MGLKYSIQYNDTENIVHRCEIYDDNYTGNEIEVTGSVILNSTQTENALDSFRGQGLTINLDASLTRKFSELFTSEERTFKVIYIRDNTTQFVGWVDPEGYFEDYVNDFWQLSVNCIDGLSFLKDLSYVDNSTGFPFSGKFNQLETIVNCLKRTNLDLNINTNIDIYYTGLSTSLDILDNVYSNSERYIKDDENTIMSCEEVLKDILDMYTACITMFEGEWWIYKPNQLYSEQSPTFFRYDKDGAALSPTTVTKDLGTVIGSHVNGFYPHHVNQNQSLSLKKAIGAFRVTYKYGFIKSLLDNPFLDQSGGSIPNWTIDSFTNLTLNASGLGVDLETIKTPTPGSVKNLTSDSISVGVDDLLTYRLKYQVTEYTGSIGAVDPRLFNYKIVLVGVSTYYWAVGSWTTTDTTLTRLIPTMEDEVDILEANLGAMPIAGDLEVQIWTPTEDLAATTDTTVHLQEFSIYTQPQENAQAIEGETHTVQRTTNPSIKVEEGKEVITGDNPSDIYIGALYENDESTNTATWFRKGITEELALLRIMCEETLRLNAKNMYLFSGDIYGFIPMLSVVQIDNLDGFYVFIEYAYDTKQNIITGKLKQIWGDELTDIEYTLTFDYGNVVRPTITG